MGKSGVVTVDEQREYDDIVSKVPIQRVKFADYIKQLAPAARDALVTRCQRLGFNISFDHGTLSYRDDFAPLQLQYELCCVRHGKTEGNTEPRIYQGQVDYPDNQLNKIGLQQAEDAAAKMEAQLATWMPDLVVSSPLQRAIDTGAAFRRRHPDVPHVVVETSAEMAFGNWDGARVIDIDHESYAHLFYIDQNALVKAGGPHVVGASWCQARKMPGETIVAEDFITVLERIEQCLREIERLPELQDILKHRTARVLMYGHSMAGAAISMLLGHGKRISGTKDLGFDGSYIMPNATPTMLLPKLPSP